MAERNIGMATVTAVGLGAIIGAGIFTLSGTAIALAGVWSIFAFALVGVVAVAISPFRSENSPPFSPMPRVPATPLSMKPSAASMYLYRVKRHLAGKLRIGIPSVTDLVYVAGDIRNGKFTVPGLPESMYPISGNEAALRSFALLAMLSLTPHRLDSPGGLCRNKKSSTCNCLR